MMEQCFLRNTVPRGATDQKTIVQQVHLDPPRGLCSGRLNCQRNMSRNVDFVLVAWHHSPKVHQAGLDDATAGRSKRQRQMARPRNHGPVTDGRVERQIQQPCLVFASPTRSPTDVDDEGEVGERSCTSWRLCSRVRMEGYGVDIPKV